ncbi:hypothetical protein CE91St62_21010 [Lachnospiraceae bacterium]|uniref:hypothetical protein n=1 Tax=Extibacter sp. GGCC_0201 TaxID=2731209 RepID=UPI001FB5E6E1|nr:hypothetical protein [Extibacter sp. GGCC_0201]MBO1719304.1 hypothetical protein [Extibacter sp. GGCC_0201]BDF34036.1 hypothetical protein CE91St61_21110 [Lachnospiraceae bacterium]BDF38040.1 hypothetical protein CE91St62_21010 [Lachnospiraceae bacterium]
MKKAKKRILPALLAVLAMVVLSGCGGMSKEDAKAYAQSVLDAQYKGEFKEYIKQTESTEKEAKEMYEGNLDQMLTEAGIDKSTLPEEMVENYRNLFLDVGKQVDYKLGDAKEADDDSFTIDVKIKPLTAFEGLEDEVLSAVQSELADTEEIPAQDKINELVYGKMYDLLSEKIANPEYGDEQVITIHVKPDKEGVYYIPDEDLTALDNASLL